MAIVESLALLVTADTTQAVRSLGQVEGASSKLGATTPRLSAVGQTLTRTLTPAALAAGAAFGTAFNQFDAGADALRAAGASGDEFTESMKRVASQVPESFGEVGQVMGELYQRTRLTGPQLEELTQQVIELGRLGQSVSVEQLTASLTRAGVSAEGMSDALDVMYRVAQTTGTPVAKLSELQEQFGAVLAETGLSLEDQLLLLGQMEAQGVNTSGVMSGLTRAYRTLAASTEDPAAAMTDLLQRMADAEGQAEATALGNAVFGRSAVEVAAAAQSGALDIEALSAAYAQNTDTVHEAGAGMLDFADQLKIWQNRLVGAIGPLGEIGMILSGVAVAAGPTATGLSKVGQALKGMSVGGTALKLHDIGQSMLAIGPAAIAAGVAVAGLYAVWQQNQRNSAAFAQGVETVAAAIKEAGNESDGLASVIEQSVESSSDMALGLGQIGATAADLQAALSGSDGDFEAFRNRLEEGGAESQLLAMHLGTLRDVYRDGAEASGAMGAVLEDVTAAEEDEAAAAEDAANAHQRATDRIRDQVDALKELGDTLNAGFSASLDYQNAVLDTTSAVEDLNTAYTDGVTSADDIRRAELDLQAQFQEQSLAAVAVAESMALLDGRHLSAAEKADIQRAELIKLRDQFPSLIGEIDGMIDALDRVPSKVEAKVEVNVQDAIDKLDILNGALNIFGGPRPTGKPPKRSSGSQTFNINGSDNPDAVAARTARRVRRYALEHA